LFARQYSITSDQSLGSGKTFTMIGNENAGPGGLSGPVRHLRNHCDPCAGVMVLAMQELFRRIDALKSENLFRVKMSYVEVYK
jgi:hypothetical protein